MNEQTVTSGEALVDWLTYDLDETERTQAAVKEILTQINTRGYSTIQELYAAWDQAVAVWATEEA